MVRCIDARAPRPRFELGTFRLTGGCIYQLSYRGMKLCVGSTGHDPAPSALKERRPIQISLRPHRLTYPHLDLNQGPSPCHRDAPPLSYTGTAAGRGVYAALTPDTPRAGTSMVAEIGFEPMTSRL